MRGTFLVLAILVVLGSFYYKVEVQPPPPTPCGSVGGPPITATRVQLSDGRYLAYKETGVERSEARYKLVFCHGFSSTKVDVPRASKELLEELGVYIVSFDRAGYAESDPNPSRTLRSDAQDIVELADALNLGSRIYLIGYSMGGYPVWSAIRYLPGRIAGVALMSPVINYRWPSFPKNLSSSEYNKQQLGDQWALRVAHYAPWLLHWWMKQSWLPTSTVIKGSVNLPNRADAKIRDTMRASGMMEKRKKLATQQGMQESYFRDMTVMFGKWEFDPMELQKPPFPVHIWQGDEDGLVPVVLQRYIASKLGWVEYHELAETGHYFGVIPGLFDTILKTLLVE